MNKQPVVYYQTDPRWSKVDYSTKGEKTTIGASGCGPTAMAMVLATWCDKNVTPKTECAWALRNGYKVRGQGTSYDYFTKAAKRYGLNCRLLNASSIYGESTSPFHATAKGAVNDGHLVIACMGPGTWTSNGHFVLMWGVDGNVVYINDPYTKKAACTRGNYATFKKQVKYYYVIDNPKGRIGGSVNTAIKAAMETLIDGKGLRK